MINSRDKLDNPITNPEVSIIVRTCNEQFYFHQCLEEIFKQEDAPPFEVIVVDGGSTDDTLSVCNLFPVRVLKMDRTDFSFGRALNLGCHRTRGQFLVFLSGHAIPKDSRWLKELMTPFDANYVAAVHGRQIAHPNATPLVQRFAEDSFHLDRQLGPCDFSNTHCAIRRSIWEQLPFDELAPAGEDKIWMKAVLAKGYTIRYAKKACIYHSHNHSLAQFYHRYLNDILPTILVQGKPHWLRMLSDVGYNLFLDVAYVAVNRHRVQLISRAFGQAALKIVALFQRLPDVLALPSTSLREGL